MTVQFAWPNPHQNPQLWDGWTVQNAYPEAPEGPDSFRPAESGFGPPTEPGQRGTFYVDISSGALYFATGTEWLVLATAAEGPEGPAGPPGRDGNPRFSGIGPPPDFIVGAAPGDIYLDTDSGDLYKLQ